MADNTQLNTGTGGDVITTDELTYSGDTAKLPVNRFVHVTGAEGAKTLHEVWFAEDAAHTTGDYGLQFLAVRTDTPANKSGADGDYEPLQLSAGRLWVSATVDAALPAGTNAIGKLAANSGVDIGDVDVTSVIPGTAATNLGKAVDSSAGATDTGVAVVGIRDDNLSTLTPVDGDYVNARMNSRGATWVDVDRAAQPDYDTGAGTVLTTAFGLVVAASGGPVAITGDAAQGLDVDVTRVIPGTAATALGKAIDTAAGATDTGVATLAIRDDSLSALTPAEGDWVPLRTNSTGALHVTGGGGGTQYNVDDAAGATDTGTLLLAVRDDALTTLTPVDGDYVQLRTNSTGALHVTGGGGGTEYVVDAAAPATPTGTASLMERDDALAGLTPIEGDWSHQFCDANGALWVSVSAALPAGDNNIGNVDIASAIPAGDNNIGNVDVVSQIPGTGATNLGKAEDAAHTTGDVGVMGLAVRTDTPANRSGANGDYEPLQVSAGRLWCSTTVTSTVPGTGATNLGKAEDAAHTSGDVGVMGLAVRTATPINRSGTDGDYEPLQVSAGRLWCSTTVTSSIPGTGATNLGKAIDTAAGATDTGVAMLAIRDDLKTTLTPVDGDWVPLRTNLQGSLWAAVEGDAASGDADIGNPVKVGYKAIAFGTSPGAVSTTNRANAASDIHGIQFSIGGHPAMVTRSVRVLDADGAQTNAALATVGSGFHAVVTRLTITADGSNSGNVNCTVGFGTASVPTPALAGADDILADFIGVPAGGGVTIGNGGGVIGAGADNEDIRYTCEDPVGGGITITVSYYLLQA